jgi:hypothetical protein
MRKLLSKISVDSVTGCWNFNGSTAGRGYGQIYGYPKTKLAHRVSYELHKGAIPSGLCVCHKCDNMKCVNPDHLFLGTVAENNQDMIAKGRGVQSNLPHPKGELHPRTRLSDVQVSEIRELCSNSGMTQTQIGELYGIKHAHVSRIKLLQRRY